MRTKVLLCAMGLTVGFYAWYLRRYRPNPGTAYLWGLSVLQWLCLMAQFLPLE